MDYGRTTHRPALERFCACSRAIEGNAIFLPCRKIEMMRIANFL